MSDHLGRRDFVKVAGISAATLGNSRRASAESQGETSSQLPADTKYPKLSIITTYSAQRLAFAAQAGYEGVVIPLDDYFDPDKLRDGDIDRILATARNAGIRIISIECMWGINHIARDAGERRNAQARFIRCLEFGHRLGCKFVGTFSGGIPGASIDDQVKALADAVNQVYVPQCDKLDLTFGFENYPTGVNFATVPGTWEKLFAQIPSSRFGLEFDPSHFVRQFIDPIQTAWNFRERIRAVHLKDTELITPVLNQVGIHGSGWWRYRIPGQGLIDWPKFFTVLLQVGFRGGMAVEHEDEFWDESGTEKAADMPQARKDGFLLAARFVRQFMPGRVSLDTA